MTEVQIAQSLPGMTKKEVVSCITALLKLVSTLHLAASTISLIQSQQLLSTEKGRDGSIIFHWHAASDAKK